MLVFVVCFSDAFSNGHLNTLQFETHNNRIVNPEHQCFIDLNCEIFGLAFCEVNDYLLIATNVGLKGWNNSQGYCVFIIYFKIKISNLCRC